MTAHNTMGSAVEALHAGMTVTAFRRQTCDGVPVAIFLCGELEATGTDWRFIEVFVGGSRRRLAFANSISDLLLHESEVYTARGLKEELRSRVYLEAQRRAREEFGQ